MNYISKIKYYARKAREEPELIKSFIELKAKSLLYKPKILYMRHKLPSQLERINELREKDNYLLIVLDACRYDALNEVADEYFEDKEVEPVFGAARNTFLWGKNVWGGGEYDAKYISGAVPLNNRRGRGEESQLDRLYGGYTPSEHVDIREAWQEAWSEEVNSVPPEPITEIALKENKPKMVVHYYQPHAPFIGEEKEEGEELYEGKAVDEIIWKKAQNGEITSDRLWKLYTSNLRRSLKAAKELIEKVEHDNIIITADHGEALGELGVYAHPKHIDHPKVRKLPWIEIK